MSKAKCGRCGAMNKMKEASQEARAMNKTKEVLREMQGDE